MSVYLVNFIGGMPSSFVWGGHCGLCPTCMLTMFLSNEEGELFGYFPSNKGHLKMLTRILKAPFREKTKGGGKLRGWGIP